MAQSSLVAALAASALLLAGQTRSVSNTSEKTLKPGAVTPASFGKLYSYYVDGSVYAQPLYRRVAGRNLLFVVTMNDKAYAFDADRAGPPVWMRDLTDEAAGVTPVPVTDITNNNDLNLVGNIGIEGTPVIDPEASAIFFVARTKERGQYVQRLHKLELRSGKDLKPPATIAAAVPGAAADAVNGRVAFDPKAGNQRPALALAKGSVIVAWASHEDIRPYHGWVVAYDAATLKQQAAFCVTPDGREGGIWQSGRGPVVDETGAIYFETGNGDWDGKRNFGTSLIKLRLKGGELAVEDYFTPHDYADLNRRDADFGSTGPVMIPGTNTIVAGSKNGTLFLFDKDRLGHMTESGEGLLQTLPVNGGRILAGPAIWDGPLGKVLYLWCEADVLKGFRFDGRTLETAPLLKAVIVNKGSPGGTVTVSSDGGAAGSGIVWATHTNNKSADHGNAPGVLRAFDAESLKELWNSEQNPKRDRLGTLVKFVPPLVENGKVYVPNYDNAVNVYGLLP
jgi:hypothetical protein